MIPTQVSHVFTMQQIMLKFEDNIGKDVVLLIQDFAWGPTTTTSADWDAAIHYEGDFSNRLFDACSRGHTAIADWVLASHHAGQQRVQRAYTIEPRVVVINFTSALQAACGNGHLATAKWLVIHGATNFDYNVRCAFRAACEHGQLATAKWLETQGYVGCVRQGRVCDMAEAIRRHCHLLEGVVFEQLDFPLCLEIHCVRTL